MTNLDLLSARANAGDQAALEELLNPRMRPALIAATWRECITYPDGYRIGRNMLPEALWDAYAAGVLTSPEEIGHGLVDAWASCEFPGLAIPSAQWLTLFNHAGFVDDLGPAEVEPLPLTLYRAAPAEHRFGMSWTSSPTVALFFAERNERWGFYEDEHAVAVEAKPAANPDWRPLAKLDSREEHEWVMDGTPAECRPLSMEQLQVAAAREAESEAQWRL